MLLKLSERQDLDAFSACVVPFILNGEMHLKILNVHCEAVNVRTCQITETISNLQVFITF
jgi:hypothetical protein